MGNISENKLIPTNESKDTWIKILFAGGIIYVFLLMAILITHNPIVFPTFINVGSFLIPVSFVYFLYERRHLSRIKFSTLTLAFLYGGLLAVLVALLLGQLIETRNFGIIEWGYFGINLKIGLVEEFAKILGVIIIARHRRHDSEMDGLIIGAAVGMGFAALESSGYAFTAFMLTKGNILATSHEIFFRNLTAPFGHGAWTAILASVLFRECQNGQFHYDFKLIGTYLFVSLLHAIWDYYSNNKLFSSEHMYFAFAVIGIVGLTYLWFRYKEGIKLQLILPPETCDI
jgi:protease PrsW